MTSRFALLPAIVLALAPVAARCMDPISLPEAETYNDAVGNMKYMSLINDVMGEECSSRVPSLKEEVRTALSAWKNVEARVIKRADAYWTALSAQDASLGPLLLDMRRLLRGQLAELSTQAAKGTDSELAAYCRHHFKELAAGTWRNNTPRLHRFLEEEM